MLCTSWRCYNATKITPNWIEEKKNNGIIYLWKNRGKTDRISASLRMAVFQSLNNYSLHQERQCTPNRSVTHSLISLLSALLAKNWESGAAKYQHTPRRSITLFFQMHFSPGHVSLFILSPLYICVTSAFVLREWGVQPCCRSDIGNVIKRRVLGSRVLQWRWKWLKGRVLLSRPWSQSIPLWADALPGTLSSHSYSLTRDSSTGKGLFFFFFCSPLDLRGGTPRSWHTEHGGVWQEVRAFVWKRALAIHLTSNRSRRAGWCLAWQPVGVGCACECVCEWVSKGLNCALQYKCNLNADHLRFTMWSHKMPEWSGMVRSPWRLSFYVRAPAVAGGDATAETGDSFHRTTFYRPYTVLWHIQIIIFQSFFIRFFPFSPNLVANCQPPVTRQYERISWSEERSAFSKVHRPQSRLRFLLLWHSPTVPAKSLLPPSERLANYATPTWAGQTRGNSTHVFGAQPATNWCLTTNSYTEPESVAIFFKDIPNCWVLFGWVRLTEDTQMQPLQKSQKWSACETTSPHLLHP